ncbi:MAG: cyclase family protein [Bacillota bacterium]|jgi:kynurenine formamidase
MSRLIDLSHEIRSAMPVYPGDEPTELVQTRFLAEDQHNNHRLVIGMHSGTHLDAPLHMLGEGACIADLPLESFTGPGCLLDVRGQAVIRWQPDYGDIVRPGSVVLLYTGHDRFFGEPRYFADHPCVDEEFCARLIEKKARLLGMDLPSPDRPPFRVHQALLRSGIYLLENLTRLDQLLGVRDFEVIALPLKLQADGSPVRAVARLS